MYHEFHSNKCESLNGNITKYVPKNKHYCCTLSNKGLMHTAVDVDSIGYEEFYQDDQIEIVSFYICSH
jgi:hypothetical protein